MIDRFIISCIIGKMEIMMLEVWIIVLCRFLFLFLNLCVLKFFCINDFIIWMLIRFLCIILFSWFIFCWIFRKKGKFFWRIKNMLKFNIGMVVSRIFVSLRLMCIMKNIVMISISGECSIRCIDIMMICWMWLMLLVRWVISEVVLNWLMLKKESCCILLKRLVCRLVLKLMDVWEDM